MMNNFFKHFRTVCKHKYWVANYCFKAGLYWRGIKHDMSKFSPTEFLESIKYYQGTSSPIDACKKDKGWSKSWQHHKGRNDHHYEYWIDDLDHGGKPLLMPKDCAFEMVCDYLGAGRAYMGKNFSYEKEYEWWMKKNQLPLLMDERIKTFVTLALRRLSLAERYWMLNAIDFQILLKCCYREATGGK
jgi:hypothetical protein